MSIFNANFAKPALQLPWCREPFMHALQHLHAEGLPMHGVLWVLPRVALSAELEHAWLATYAPGSSLPQLAPWVQSADRLSQPTVQAPWYGLVADVAALLAQQPSLGGHLPAQALWRLADEYLQLALRVVARQQGHGQADTFYQTFDALNTPNPLARLEVQCVQQIAQLLEEQLLPLLPKALSTPGPVQAVVWFDDGDPWPGFWITQHYANVPCQRVVLPMAQGPNCWQEAVAYRAAGTMTLGLTFAAAPDESRQAQQAAHQVMQWLHQDPNAAVVVAVLDRLAARRMVAVLADAGVFVDDRTGWRLSTATVAAWFDGVLSSKLPHETAEHTLAGWAQVLLNELQALGQQEALQNDAAGRLLLYSLGLCLATRSQAVWSLAAWQVAWRFVAEGLRFRPNDRPSPVRLMPLLSTRMHGHARVLVLGCAQRHFQESPPGLLPPPVLAELGLVGPRLVRQQKLSALLELIRSVPQVHLVHAAMVQGQAQRLLPELQWLHIVRTQHHQSDWQQAIPSSLYAVQPRAAAPLQLCMAWPSKGQPVLPTVPVRGLEDWQDCPLRFGLKHAMPWPIRPWPKPKTFEQIRGVFVHKVLEKTCQTLQGVVQSGSSITAALWRTQLQTHMHTVWQALPLAELALLLPFLGTLERLLPDLARCLQQRYDEGWRLQQQEGRVTGQVPLPWGQAVPLVGRVDRVEVRHANLCIVDVKTSSPSRLRTQAKTPQTTPQLPVYQALLNAHHAELAYLTVHEDGVAWLPLAAWSDTEAEVASWGGLWMRRLQQQWAEFFDGHTLWQAQASAKVCGQCDVRMLCRPEVDAIEDELSNTEESA